MPSVVYLGGEFLESAEARVALDGPGYLLGDGVFATLRAYRGACFRVEAHVAQLERGAARFGIPISMSAPELADLADETARRCKADDAYVRITLTRGPTLSVLARETQAPAVEAYALGIAAVTVGPRRIPPTCMDPTIKTTSYAPQVLARREAEERRGAEGVQLALDGSLACGTMSNLFVVRGNDLLTPSLETGCRAGITRAEVIALAPALGFTVRETRLDPDLLREANEAFFTSTRVECLPMRSLDGHVIADAFPRTAALRAALRTRIDEDTARRR